MRPNCCSGKLCPMQVGAADNCALTKEQCPYFTQDVDVLKVLNQIKAEVARGIFEEIETVLYSVVVPTIRADGRILGKTLDGLHIRIEDYNTIKKKYTEEYDGNSN